MIDDRIRNFIAHGGQAAVCDDCIALHLALPHRQQAQRVTRRLSASGKLRRELGRCAFCREMKLVSCRQRTPCDDGGCPQLGGARPKEAAMPGPRPLERLVKR
jgi:hypothetical protein